MQSTRQLVIAACALALLALPAPVFAETLLIGNKGENTVSFVDLGTGKERSRQPTGSAPHEIAISPDGKQAAVVAYGGQSVDIFDVEAAKLVRRVDISPNASPHGIAWLKDGRIVLAAEKSRSVVVIAAQGDTITSIPTAQAGTHMVVVSPDRKRAYAANVGAGTVSIIDLQKGSKLSDIAVGGNPEGLALTRDGKRLWVGDNSGPRLRIVDLASGKTIQTLPTDPVAIRVAISPDGKTAITSNIGSGTINVFDVATAKPIRTIAVSGARDAIQVTAIFSHDGKHLFVAETGRNTIAEVDVKSGTVLRRIAAGRGGDGLAIAP